MRTTIRRALRHLEVCTRQTKVCTFKAAAVQLSVAVLCGIGSAPSVAAESMMPGHAKPASLTRSVMTPANVQSGSTTTTSAVVQRSTSGAAAEPKRIWNLHGVSLRNVIDQVAHATGKTFIVDPRVKGKVDLVSNRPMSPAQLYQTFLAVLQVQGYAAVLAAGEDQHTFKIVPNHEAARAGLPLRSEFYPGRGSEMVTRVFNVKNISAIELVSVLRPLLAQQEALRAVPSANALVLSGPASTLLRVGRIIKRVDVATDTGIEMLPLHYASAAEMVGVLEPLLNNDRYYKRVAPVTLAADDRSNSLLMTGSKASRLRVRVLVSQLDTPKSFGGDTQVVYLHFLQAKDFAPVLRKVSKTTTAASGESKLAARVAIEAEPKTNALVISAPPLLMRSLKNVVARLDIRPAQVSVEAVIVEMDDATLKKLGVQWGTVSADGRFASSSDSGFQSGVGVIRIGGTLKHPSFSTNNLRAVVSALKGDSHTNILSTPSLVVLDNQKARIEVGNTVSIETGSYATTGNTQTAEPFVTFDRQKIGLHLEVTPQISQGESVRLTIDQGNETLRDPEEPGSRPVTNNSSITTQVIVRSGDILVLGGLISNDLEQSHSQIPLLGSIPVAGKLFHYKRTRMSRKNLMVFLRPVILRNDADNHVITRGKYHFMRHKELQAEALEHPQVHLRQRRRLTSPRAHSPVQHSHTHTAQYHRNHPRAFRGQKERVLQDWDSVALPTSHQSARRLQKTKQSRAHKALPKPFTAGKSALSTKRQRSWH